MEVETLKAFLYIAEGHTFFDTAEEFNMSQSSISKAVYRMEHELGVQLFSRDKRTVQLTPAGEYFYRDLKNIIDDFDLAVNHLRAWNNGDYIAFSAFPNIDQFNLRQILLDYMEQNREILFDVESYEDFESAETALLDGKLNFIVAHLPRSRKGMNVRYLCDDPLCVVLPRSHPLAVYDKIPFEMMKKEIVFVGRYSIGYLRKICDSHNIYPVLKTFKKPFETTTGILSGVANGHAIAIFFKNELEGLNTENVVCRQLSGVTELPLCIMWNENIILNERQNSFLDYLCAGFRYYRK